MDYVTIFLQFLGGLGLFILGMSTMAEGLQKAAGPKLRNLIESLTKTKFLGVLVGALVTAIIHSSSATTVMVVGFVNAGLMDLTQSVGVIMGANIGTTITSWMIATMEWFGDTSSFVQFLSPEFYAPIALFIGVFITFFSNKRKVKQAAEIIAGFGMLFFGMTIMSAGVAPLAESPAFREAFIAMGNNPILGLLAGLVITGIIQSSAASVGILQSLAIIGLVPRSAAIYIIMGQNIGTCATALLSSIGASKTAKAASYIHLLFNVIGSVVFMIISVLIFQFIIPNWAGNPISSTQISIAHTTFNIANTLLLYPFSKQLVSLSEKLAGIKAEDKIIEDESVLHLDDRLLETPAAAINSLTKEVARMGKLAEKNIYLSMEALLGQDQGKIDQVMTTEQTVNKLNHGISDFLIKFSGEHVSVKESQEISSMFHIINDIERISDHCENIADLALETITLDISFTDAASTNLIEISNMAAACVNHSILALLELSSDHAEKALALESAMDSLEKEYREDHIRRLRNNQCSVENGVIFIDSLTNLERISDHSKNIAQLILEYFIEAETV